MKRATTQSTVAFAAALALLFAPAFGRAADPTAQPTAAQKTEKPTDKPVDKATGAAEPSTTVPAGDPAPADVLSKLHHSNQMEIEAGKLAQEKAQSKSVKDYGKMLVRDHQAADKKVRTVAKQLKVELAPPPEMKHEKLEKARVLSGAEFDKAFTEAMLEDHKTDVQEAKDARDSTTNPKLKKLLTEVVPKLEKHREAAEKLAADPEAKLPK